MIELKDFPAMLLSQSIYKSNLANTKLNFAMEGSCRNIWGTNLTPINYSVLEIFNAFIEKCRRLYTIGTYMLVNITTVPRKWRKRHNHFTAMKHPPDSLYFTLCDLYSVNPHSVSVTWPVKFEK